MKQIISFVICAIMAISTVTASAAEPAPMGSDTEQSAPTGYFYGAKSVAEYSEDEVVLGEPLVAYTWDYLDTLAIENGYVIEEPKDGAFRIYTMAEPGYVIHVIIRADIATSCIHTDPNMPGAIMGVALHADETVVYSTVDIVDLLF